MLPDGATLRSFVSTLIQRCTRQSSALSTQQTRAMSTNAREWCGTHRLGVNDPSLPAPYSYWSTTDVRLHPYLSVAVLRIQLPHPIPVHRILPTRLSPTPGSYRGAISRRDPRRLSCPRIALERKMAIRVRQHRVGLDLCCGRFMLWSWSYKIERW